MILLDRGNQCYHTMIKLFLSMSLKHNHTALFEEFKRYALTIQKSFTQSYLNIYLCLLKSLKSNIAK